MDTLRLDAQLASAYAVRLGQRGDVSRLAHTRGCSRQRLYREAHALTQALDGSHARRQLQQAHQRLAQLQAEVAHLRQQLRQAVVLDDDRLAHFAACAQAEGVPRAAARTLLVVLRGPRAPSVATLGRRAQEAARRCGPLLQVLDQFSRRRARQVAPDELFSGPTPILMVVEPHSLCWLAGRRASSRDGQQWEQEFAALPALEQVTSDRAQGLRKGLQRVNAARKKAQQPQVADQSDHFHPLRRARQGLRACQKQAERALEHAGQLQTAHDDAFRRGEKRTAAQGRAVNQAWRTAEEAFDRWSEQEAAFGRLRQALRLFTPEGELNTAERARAEVEAALGCVAGPCREKVQRGLKKEAFTFLRRTQERLQALPVEPALVQAAVRAAGLRARPEVLAGEGLRARALRGVLLAVNLVLALAGEAGGQALRVVREVLGEATRASSSVEAVNGVLRRHQARQRRLTQALIDLKRLRWNLQVFRAGKRKKQSPYGLLGLRVPDCSWWELLHWTPEQLRQELSALNPEP